jgi:nitroreductase
MDTYQTIVTKRDRREYSAKPLSDETVHRILQAGRMAGSSSNSQPVRFVVYRNRQNMQALMPFGRGTRPLEGAQLFVLALLKEGARDFDVGRAFQNMMVAAWAEGVISCPVGLQDPAADAVVGVPEGYKIAIGIAFGHPAEGSAAAESRPRIAMDDLFHYEKW